MSCSLQKLDLCIRKGATVELPIRIESGNLGYAAISAVAQSAPARITAAEHGIPDGWRVAVVNVAGMTEINAEVSRPGATPKDSAFVRVTRVDDDTLDLNSVNAAGFRAYKSGGQVVFWQPLDLTQYEGARMEVKNKVGGNRLAFWSTADNTLDLDQVNQCLWLKLSDEETAEIEWASGVFDIELLRSGGEVDALCSADSTITVLPEVTTEAV
jgi:hypothetical protein